MKDKLFILALLEAAKAKAAGLAHLTAPPRSRTPNIPHHGRHSRTRAKAPNDGRWHMKFHRGRV